MVGKYAQLHSIHHHQCNNKAHQYGSQGFHYSDVIMSAMASQITIITIVCSTVYSGADQRKHESSTSLAFVQGIHRPPVNSPHKGPVTRKKFPFDDVIMYSVAPVVLKCHGHIRSVGQVSWTLIQYKDVVLPYGVNTSTKWPTICRRQICFLERDMGII